MILREKRNWQTYLPYACSIVAIPICYTSVLLGSGQQMLAMCATVLGTTSAFFLCGIAQKRGQVSLAVMIFVFPLLIASACAIYLRLSSFVLRQNSIDMLRNGQIGFRASLPVRTDEWLRDSRGTMLPVWLAKAIGSDCLSIVYEIHGELKSIQSINFNKLDVSEIRLVQVAQTENDSHLTDELIHWLNRCPHLEEVQFTFSAFSSVDGQALSKLRFKKQITILDSQLLVDLSSLSEVPWQENENLKLNGSNLSERVSRQLSKLAIPCLILECDQLSPETVIAFQGYKGHLSVVRGVTPENIRDFAKLGRDSIELSNIVSMPIELGGYTDDLRKTRQLFLRESPISAEDCRNLATLFQCEKLWLSNVLFQDSSHSHRIDLAPFEDTASKELDSLWESPSLMQIYPNNDPRKKLTRPIDVDLPVESTVAAPESLPLGK